MPTAQAAIAITVHMSGGDNAIKTKKTRPSDKNMNSTPDSAQMIRVLWFNGTHLLFGIVVSSRRIRHRRCVD